MIEERKIQKVIYKGLKYKFISIIIIIMNLNDSYYTLLVLNIYYNETEYLHLVIKATTCRFYCYCDEDDIMYDAEVIEDRKRALTVSKKPILIYVKSTGFNKPLCEEKYKAIVENYILKYGKTFDDVVKIIKVEKKLEQNKITFVDGRYHIEKDF